MPTLKKANKFLVVTHLLSNDVSIDEILNATARNLNEKGFVFGDKIVPVEGEVFTALSKHVQTLPEGCSLLFPGKESSRQSNANFLVSLQGYLKSVGKTLQDFGIPSAYSPRVVRTFDSVADIRRFLNDKLGKSEEAPKVHPGRPHKTA